MTKQWTVPSSSEGSPNDDLLQSTLYHTSAIVSRADTQTIRTLCVHHIQDGAAGEHGPRKFSFLRYVVLYGK